MPIPQNVRDIMNALKNAKHEAYLIGGSVRDYVISQCYKLPWLQPKDYDIFTNATGEEILSLFPQGIVMGNEERQEKILTVVVDGVEVSQYRKSGDRTETGTSILDHIHTCDFTMNAILCDSNGYLYDNVDGIRDIERGIINTVGAHWDRFKEDYLRVLRAIRFYAMLQPFGFTLHLEVAGGCRVSMSKVFELPADRIHTEVLKIFSYGGETGAKYLMIFKIFEHMFPELYECYKIPNHGKWHPEHVGEHIQNTFINACGITRNPLLRIAAHLHDIGKARAYDPVEKTFYQHHKIGADLLREELPKWRFTNEEIDYIAGMVYHHMDDLNNIKQVNKMVRELHNFGGTFEDYCVLAWSDRNANQSWQPLGYNEWLQKFEPYTLYKKSLEHPTVLSVKSLAINGNDLIGMGVKPGPIIGNILNKLLDMVDNCELVNEMYSLKPVAQQLINKNSQLPTT